MITVNDYNNFQNMEIDKNFTFLTSVDFKKFVVNEPKKQMQSAKIMEYRNSTQRSSLTQISFSHSFSSETLITNVEVQCYNWPNFDATIQSIQLEFSELANRGHYLQLINLKSQRELNSIVFSGYAFTHCIKINLLLKSQLKKKNMRSNQRQTNEIIQKLIVGSVKDINVYGISINSSPSSILLTKLLNISQMFKKYNMIQQSIETDILVSLSLISARRFVQAAEILRKISKFYVQKYNSNKSLIDYSKTQKSWIKEVDDEVLHSSIRTNFGSGRILEGSKFLQRAAKIQLLLAQTISHPSLVMQKLQAYHRCNCYASGNTNHNPFRPDADLQDMAMTIFPQIIGFLLKMLSDKLEPIRVSALKSIQFFIQTLGCSIGITFLQILREVIGTYPNNSTQEINPNRVPHGLLQLDLISQKLVQQQSDLATTGVKNKILIDHYHHLLQTLLSLTLQINRRMILSVFGEIIVPGLLSKTQNYQLKLYLLRFAQKTVSISGADLNIQVSFIGLLLTFCQQKNISKAFLGRNSINKNDVKSSSIFKQEGNGMSQNKHVIHNLVYFSHKILNQLKIKVFPGYSGHKLESLLDWINKTLAYLGQNEILSNNNSHRSLFVFTTILDLVLSIYSPLRYDYNKINCSPIQTIMYFANMAMHNHQAGIPFDKVIATLSILLKYHVKMQNSFQLHKQIISRILQKSKQNNLSLKQLQVLIKILQITDNQDNLFLFWLDTYLGSIPHSTFDQTYQVFNLMLIKGTKKIDQYPNKYQILKKIVKTMLDQYTVKGKAHQQSKETLINSLTSSKAQNILLLIKICLFDNIQPKPEQYYSKKKQKAPSKINKQVDHHFDSKSYRIDFQMFMQKISFAQLILTKISNEEQICQTLMNQNFIQNFFEYAKSLTETQNLKLKSKALSLINHYLQISAFAWKQQKFRTKLFFLIIRNIFSISRSLAQRLKQSKLMYSVIYNLMNLFRIFEIQPENYQKTQQSKLQKLNEQFEEYLRNQKDISYMDFSIKRQKGQRFVNFLLMRELIKVWPILSQSLYSPWENVRQMYIILILQAFKQGLSISPQSSRKKIIQISKQLMLNLFTSSQHTERLAGLKIFGCLIGLRVFNDNKNNQIATIISQNLRYLKLFIEKVFDATYDWDQTNIQIAQNLCEICMSEQMRSVSSMRRKQNFGKKGVIQLDNSYLSFNLGDEMNYEKKSMSTLGINNNLQSLLLKQSWVGEEDPISLQFSYMPIITQQTLVKICQFKALIQKDIQMRTEVFVQKQSFLQQNEQQFYDPVEQKADSIEAKDKSEDEHLEFEDLGIIQLDDEQWGEQQEKQQKAVQKLSIKKINKLSPSVLNSSKPQRIRSKRFHQNEFDYRENIIVDELQQKITNQNIKDNSIDRMHFNNEPYENKNSYFIPQNLAVTQKKDAQQKNQKNAFQKDKNQMPEKYISLSQKMVESNQIQQKYQKKKSQNEDYKIQYQTKEVKKDSLNGQRQYHAIMPKEKDVEKRQKKNSSAKKRKLSSGK